MSSNHPGSFAIYLRRLHEPPSTITLSSVLQRVPPHHPPPPRPFWYRLRPTRHQQQQQHHNNNNNNHQHHQHQYHNTNRHQPAAPIRRERPVSPAAAAPPPPPPSRRTTTTTPSRPFSSPAVIFDASILVQPAAAAIVPAQPQEEHRQRPRLQGLLFRLPNRKSVSMSSLSRHEQSRSVLSDVMSLTTDDLYVADRRQGGENYRTEEETKQEVEVDNNDRPLDEESTSTTSSSVIRVFTSSWSEPPPRARSAPPATAASRPPTNPTRPPPPPPPAPQQPQQQPRPYSEEQSEQSFWVRADLEPGIVALHGSYAGRIVQRSSQPPLTSSSSSSMIYVSEQATSLYSIPTYIGKLRGWYTEIECREIFRNMCRLVRILHKHRTVHRNLHLNQFLVNPNTGEFSIRGIFDAAYLESRVAETSPRQYYTEKPIHPDHKYRRRYDWFAFRSPELDTYEVSPRHGTATDVWSMGVCLYTLLTGIPPFRGSGRTLRHSKMTAQMTPYEVTAIPSAAAQDLIARMIVVNPACRLTMKQVLAHPWMQNSFATDVDLSLTQTLFMDWDNRGSSSSSSSHRRRSRSTPRRPSSSFTNTDSSNTSSRIAIRGT